MNPERRTQNLITLTIKLIRPSSGLSLFSGPDPVGKKQTMIGTALKLVSWLVGKLVFPWKGYREIPHCESREKRPQCGIRFDCSSEVLQIYRLV